MVKQSKLLKRGVKYSLFFLFLIVLSSVSVSATSYTDFNSKQKGQLGYGYCEWREGGFFSERTSNQDGCPGNIPYLSNNTIISSLAVGANFQPFISNFVDNGDNYLITISGTDIDVLSMDSLGGLSLYAQINLGSAVNTQPIMVDLNSDTYTDMLVTNGTNLFAIYYNISDPALWTIHNVYTGTISTGISCMNMSSNIYCFMGGLASNISVYNTSSGAVTNIVPATFTGLFSGARRASTMTPVIIDYDNDGFLELIFGSDYDATSKEGISVFQLSINGVPTFERNIAVVSADVNSYIGGLTAYNLDGVGDTEICTSALDGSAAAHLDIKCFNSDGSSFGTVLICGSSSLCYPSNLVVAQIDSTTKKEVCVIGVPIAANTNTLGCVYGGNGTLSLIKTTTITGMTSANTDFRIASNDINGDNIDEIIGNSNIWYSKNSTALQNMSVSGSSQFGYWSIGDINNDGYAEACQSLATTTTCISSSGTGMGGGTNLLPEVWANFGRGYDDPVCSNTTLRFSGKHDTDNSLPLVSGTNFIDDTNDTYYLAINCYGNSTIFYGTGNSSTDPYEDCVYTNPGTYYPTVHVCDYAHSLAQCLVGIDNYETESVYVIPGVAGSTCNIKSLGVGTLVSEVTPDTPSFGGTPSEVTEGWTALFGWLTGGNTNAKLLIGFMLFLMLVVGVAVGLASLGVSGSALSVLVMLVSGLGFVLLTIIGLFPVWILVLLLLVLALITGLVLALKATGG